MLMETTGRQLSVWRTYVGTNVRQYQAIDLLKKIELLWV